jgi:hypothetical protein
VFYSLHGGGNREGVHGNDILGIVVIDIQQIAEFTVNCLFIAKKICDLVI